MRLVRQVKRAQPIVNYKQAFHSLGFVVTQAPPPRYRAKYQAAVRRLDHKCQDITGVYEDVDIK